MKRGMIATILLLLLAVATGPVSTAVAEIQLSRPDRTNADAMTLAEFEAFYDEIEKALAAEDIDQVMSFYAEDYLHYGITKKQLKFMWLEIFGEYSDLYSVHIFSRIDAHGDDSILVCTGALLGIPEEGGDYEAVDRWVSQNHWLTKVDGEWKMIGGATHERSATKGSGRLEIHPLF